jgi:hypothetical protein
LNELEHISNTLADANNLRGRDSFVRDSSGRPLELGGASTNAIAHALTSAYLAHDDSPQEAALLGGIREFKSYWSPSKQPEAWDTFKDLYNNQVGRNIAAYARKNNLSRDQMQDLVLDALSSGKLIVARDDPRIDPSLTEKPTSFLGPNWNRRTLDGAIVRLLRFCRDSNKGARVGAKWIGRGGT